MANILLWHKCESPTAPAETGQTTYKDGNGNVNVVPCKFNNGLEPDIHNRIHWISGDIWSDVSKLNQGTISFFWQPTITPEEYTALNNHTMPFACFYLASAVFSFFINFVDLTCNWSLATTPSATVTSAPITWTTNDKILLCFVWDVNGIDGSSDTMRLYKDKLLIASTTSTLDFSGSNLTSAFDFTNAAYFNSTGQDFIYDNIVILDDAVTDFTYTDNEDPYPVSKVLLWDKLENLIDPAMTGQSKMYSGTVTPTACKFNNGLLASANGTMSYWWSDIAPGVPKPTSGRIGIWIKPTISSADYQTNAVTQSLFDVKTVTPDYPLVAWYDSSSLYFNFAIGGTLNTTVTTIAQSWAANDKIRIDCVWDSSGIGGSADTARVYINNVLVGTSTGTFTFNTNWNILEILGGGLMGSAVNFIEDNLIVWKTANLDMTVNSSEAPWVYPAPVPTDIVPDKGIPDGGTAIAINGTDFLAGATAKIGGGTCTMGAITSTEINATTYPTPAGIYNLYLTNGDGQQVTLSNAFTFKLPAPTVDNTAAQLQSTNNMLMMGV